ncbi:MAG: alpha-amylase family glycosyl hydrolase [Armatimonadaceae bacterium]
MGSWAKRALRMEKDEKGWWHFCAHVPDGTHTYKFRLKSLSHFMKGETVFITDPLARRVDESQDDAAVIVIENGKDVTTTYDWQHDDVPLPQNDKLVIYELHLGEFAAKKDKPGNARGVAERLDYLVDLGINAVEFMPVQAFPGDKSWGYNLRHPCAVENAYGTPQDLKYLIDECHKRGIRVLLDMIFNHMEVEAPLNTVDYYYWFRDPKDDEPSYGAKLDYDRWDENLEIFPAREYAKAIARYWIEEYHVDGYRLDATAVINNFEFINELGEACKEVVYQKPFYLTAEQIPEDPSLSNNSISIDGAWRKQFSMQVISALCEQDREGVSSDCQSMMDALNPRNHGYEKPASVVNYIESHDESSLMQKLEECEITGDKAFRKAKLGATLLFTAVGNPMLYQGQEFGGNNPADGEYYPVQWELLENDFGLHLKAHHAFMAKLRRESPALLGKDFEPLYCDLESQLIAYRRGYGDFEVIVVANLRDEDRNFAIPFPDGKWREAVYNVEIESTDKCLQDSIDASSAKIYFRQG